MMTHMWLSMHKTLACSAAGLTSLVLSLLFGRPYIRWIKNARVKQIIRTEGPQTHLKKEGTPTMGGGLIVATAALSTLLWSDWHNVYTWLLLWVLLGTAVVGWVDDYRKVIAQNTKGLSGKLKLISQFSIALIAVSIAYAVSPSPVYTVLHVPFFKTLFPALGAWYIVLGVFVVIASSNAVNLTDGLDGLVSLPLVFVLLGFLVIAVVTSNPTLCRLAHIPCMPPLIHVAVVICALIGAVLGFLWFNIHPAEIFMGDVGSLSLGAVLGMIAVLARQELLFILMAGVFVAETMSVILQVASFRMRGGKRIFKMAPLHHHFELSGWPETRIVMRFWSISLLLVLCSLAILFL